MTKLIALLESAKFYLLRADTQTAETILDDVKKQIKKHNAKRNNTGQKRNNNNNL